MSLFTSNVHRPKVRMGVGDPKFPDGFKYRALSSSKVSSARRSGAIISRLNVAIPQTRTLATR